MQPAAVNLRGPFAALVSFQAQVSVLGVQQGRRKEWGEGVGVVPVATHQHASPLGSHYPRWPSCPVVLQGGHLDNIAGYGRNVRVGARAGRGGPTLPLRG